MQPMARAKEFSHTLGTKTPRSAKRAMEGNDQPATENHPNERRKIGRRFRKPWLTRKTRKNRSCFGAINASKTRIRKVA